MKKVTIKEDLLHYVWKTKQFDLHELCTTEGKTVTVHEWGTTNNDSGPDFFNSKILIEDTLWVGNVEMHVFSSDWLKHKHDNDEAYDNVILHVVYEENKPIFNKNDKRIPCIELKNKIPENIKKTYETLINNEVDIPCQNLITKVDAITINMWKHNLIAERLEEKAEKINKIFTENNNDWEQTMYTLLCRYMGARVNTAPFESLASHVTIKILQKNRDSLMTLEALLFGAAGMLQENIEDNYYQELKMEYLHLKKKYKNKELGKVMWKFSRMRPPNFPTIRIAQLAKIIYNQPRLFSHIMKESNLKDLRANFQATASEYWTTHYTFGKQSKKVFNKDMTDSFIDILLINVVSPMLFLYGLKHDNYTYQERATAILETIKAEKNKIIYTWNKMDIMAHTALDSQALIHLKNKYCDKKRCLSCNIGNKIVLSKL